MKSAAKTKSATNGNLQILIYAQASEGPAGRGAGGAAGVTVHQRVSFNSSSETDKCRDLPFVAQWP